MKQEVTYEQWKKLTDKQELEFANTVYLKNGEKTQKLAPPTIGQMIEFLESKAKETGFYRINFAGTPVMRKVEWYHYKFDEFDRTYQKKELCDALWDAVKEVLGNKLEQNT